MVGLLNYEEFRGKEYSTTVLILHGLFGSCQNWRSFAKKLSQNNIRVITADLRNHGKSFHHPTHSYEAMVLDVVSLLNEIGGQVHIIGHSMGGKVAMLLAVKYPEYVKRLVIIDIAPVYYIHSHLDKIDALMGVNLDNLRRRSEVEKKISGHISDPGERAFFMLNLRRCDDTFSWKINLNAIRNYMTEIMGFPSGQYKCLNPTLFVSGSESEYVRDLHLKKIESIFPNYKLEVIENCGHWVHTEKPNELLFLVNSFLVN